MIYGIVIEDSACVGEKGINVRWRIGKAVECQVDGILD